MRMRGLLVQLTEWAIPRDLREFHQREEIERGRVVSAILLLCIGVNLITAVMLSVSGGELPSAINLMLTRVAAALLPTYVAILLIFRYTAQFKLTAHLYATTTFIIYLLNTAVLPNDLVPLLLIPLLSMPLFAAMIGGLKAGMPWVIVVSAMPLALNEVWVQWLDRDAPISVVFNSVWLAPNLATAFALWCFEHTTTHMRYRLDEEVARFAFDAAHDSLTGLANRAVFARRLQEAIDHAHTHREVLALMYIDLNDFKPINDQFGHHAGDLVLTAVAERLAEIVRQSDTVARLGGDEFVVLYRHLKRRSDLDILVARIHTKIAEGVAFGEVQLHVSASIGVVCYPQDGDNAATLQQRADALMYASKQRRKAYPGA
ncbi:MAG: diguanylate cyclase domain protein [Verrucomicrobiaceae bacterium]|nr:diguanylate cyclase domain protein [Verrucomicrobiaceae bacterium]